MDDFITVWLLAQTSGWAIHTV